jgi:hypothetical protein
VTGSPPASSGTVNNLTPGTSYTFTVQASDRYGSGPASAQSGSVVPLGSPTAPSPPTGVSALPATSQALLSWSAPSDNGGSPITSYAVTPHTGPTSLAPTTVTGSPPATIATVPGLTNGTSYTFTVSASNVIGASADSSPSAALVPASTLFDFNSPLTTDAGDGNSVVLGVKFTSDVSGHVTGIRFYKAQGNTGAHIASLWSAGGTLLASATVTGETQSGWQQVYFSSPVAITAGTTYVASYFAPQGHYSVNGNAFASSVDNPPLHALANSTSVNGVYAYSSTNTFPANSYNATNYWVDVLFGAG